MVSIKNVLYKSILCFAILDVVTGVLSMVYSTLVWQLIALFVTTTTLILAVFHCKQYPKQKRENAETIIIGSIDLITGLTSVLVVVLTTQVLAIIASSFTFFKAVKIFVQSDKAKRLLTSTKPVIIKIVTKFIPIIITWVVTKTKLIKQKFIKGEKQNMNKIKIFFANMFNAIRANKITTSASLVNLVINALLGYMASGIEATALYIGSFNITPLFAIVTFILTELGISNKGWETIKEFLTRIATKKSNAQIASENKAIAKAEAEAKKIQAEKLAKAKALIEAEKAQAEELAKAKAEQDEIKALAEKLKAEEVAKEQEELNKNIPIM